MTHEELNELYELYALGALELEQASEIERHLNEGCEYCRTQVQQAFWTTSALAGLAEPAQAPKALRKQVLQIAAPERRERNWIFATAGLATASLSLLGVALWSANQNGSLHSEISAVSSQRDDYRGQVAVLKSQGAQLHRTIDALNHDQSSLQGRSATLAEERNRLNARARTLQNSIAAVSAERDSLSGRLQTAEAERTQTLTNAQALQNTVQTLERERDDLRQQIRTLDYQRNQLENERGKLQSIVAVVGNAATRALPFGGTDSAPRGHVFLTPQGGVLLVAQQLPALATDRTFQLWLVPAHGAPQSAGLFRPDTSGNVVYSPTGVRAGTAAAIAVSVEPAGGSAAPTTKPFVVVPVKS